MLKDFAKKNGVRYFLISYTDYFGIQRSKLVPTSAIEGMEKSGAGFAGFASYLDLTPADTDLFAVPDATSVVQLPWKKEVAWVSSYLKLGNDDYTVGARDVLAKVKAGAQQDNIQFKTGVECEFFLLDADVDALSDVNDTLAKPCYDQMALMRRYDLISRICDYMNDLGWEPYQNDHEDARGQFEMNWGYDDAMVTADRHAFFQFMVKSMAEEAGYRATFMAKPFTGLTGNGCHTHISAWSPEGKNLFTDPKGELGLSEGAYHFIGGMLDSAKAVSALTNPTTNSFKRLNAAVTDSGATWAPNTVTYSGNDRTHMIRIPDNDRVEVRLPDGSANPYLMQAAIIAAGHNGMRQKISCIDKKAGSENVESLPTTLHAALEELGNSAVLRESMGSAFVDSYLRLKKKEWTDYNAYISDWERDRYL